MIKDRLLKIKVVEYFVNNFWYPQMEVNILSKHRISNVPKLITDIDVLGMYSDISGSLHPILGDCKTLKGQSPISRSLWMKGLMDYMNSRKGLIVLSKDIEKEHQITSSLLDIQLLSEADFVLYSKATTSQARHIISALNQIECWDELFEIDKRFPALKSFLEFSRSQFWNESSSNYQLRSSIAVLREHRGEFDPLNRLHLAAVMNHFSLVAIAFNNIVVTLFNRYLTPRSKDELDSDLKVYIYGGIQNYEFLNNLRNRFSNNSVPDRELSLPEWDVFLELVRLVFENPRAFSYVSIFLKEIAFHFLDKGDQTRFNLGATLCSMEPQLSNYASRLSMYLCKAGGLPPEFAEIYSQLLID